VISSWQRPLPDNTRHSQQTNIHAPGGIRTQDLSRRAACGLSPHITQLHFTTLTDTSLSLIYTSLPSHLALRIYISYHSVSPHFTQLHFTTLRYTSPNSTSLHLSILHFLLFTLHYPSMRLRGATSCFRRTLVADPNSLMSTLLWTLLRISYS